MCILSLMSPPLFKQMLLDVPRARGWPLVYMAACSLLAVTHSSGWHTIEPQSARDMAWHSHSLQHSRDVSEELDKDHILYGSTDVLIPAPKARDQRLTTHPHRHTQWQSFTHRCSHIFHIGGDWWSQLVSLFAKQVSSLSSIRGAGFFTCFSGNRL